MNTEAEHKAADPPRRAPFLHRAGWGAGVAAGVGLLLAAWFARDVLLVTFTGILLAILLRAPAEWLSRRTGLPEGPAVGAVALALLAVIVGTFWFQGAEIGDQAEELRQRIPEAVARIEAQLRETSWGRQLLEKLPAADDVLPDASGAVRRATGVLSGTLSALTTTLLVIFVGLVLAISPGSYTGGIVRLVPPRRRERVREILRQLDETLRWWLAGRLASMTIVGVATGIGLALLGVPLAVVLAVIAALLTFIPNIGPVLAAVPAILLGLVESPRLALAVAGLYIGIQFVESYILAPIIDKKTIYLPPALTVVAQLAMALVAGLLGVALATPLLAVTVVLVRTLYVEDVLER